MFNIEDIKEEYKEILDKFYGIFPVPLTELAKALGYKVNSFTPDADTIKVSGFVNYKKREISINKSESVYRQRFTIAHEIGHILSGHDLNNDMDIDFRDDVDGKTQDPREVEANRKGAEILMPREEFIRKFNELKETKRPNGSVLKRPNMSIFMNLSVWFGASESAIKIRAENLKLL